MLKRNAFFAIAAFGLLNLGASAQEETQEATQIIAEVTTQPVQPVQPIIVVEEAQPACNE